MNLHLFIKKVTLTAEANSSFWGTFGRLFELPLNDIQFMALIDYFEALEAYRNYVVANLTISQGSMVKFLREENSQEGYVFFGLVEPSNYNDIVKAGPEYEKYSTKKDILFSLLGWAEVDEKVTIIDSEVDQENLNWIGIPTTFQEGTDLYERGISVSQFFKD